MSDNESLANEVPSFCKRITPEEMKEQSKVQTLNSMVELGMMYANNKNKVNTDSYDDMQKKYDLGIFLAEYYNKDGEDQKKELFQLLVTHSKIENENKNLNSFLDIAKEQNKDLQEKVDNLEEFNESIGKDNDELEQKNKELILDIHDLEQKIISKDKELYLINKTLSGNNVTINCLISKNEKIKSKYNITFSLLIILFAINSYYLYYYDNKMFKNFNLM